jgi:hypothetical protein
MGNDPTPFSTCYGQMVHLGAFFRTPMDTRPILMNNGRVTPALLGGCTAMMCGATEWKTLQSHYPLPWPAFPLIHIDCHFLAMVLQRNLFALMLDVGSIFLPFPKFCMCASVYKPFRYLLSSPHSDSESRTIFCPNHLVREISQCIIYHLEASSYIMTQGLIYLRRLTVTVGGYQKVVSLWRLF